MVRKGRLKDERGTNTREKVLGLWSVLHFGKVWGLKDLHVLGDCQVIINWALGKTQLKYLELNQWPGNTRSLMNDFNGLTFHHIFQEMNVEADSLSKLLLGNMDGIIRFTILST